jgi:lexA repressor
MREKILTLRKNKKLTQEELGSLVGVSKAAVYAWEKGAYQPEGDNLINLAGALGVSAAYLLEETDDPTPASVSKQRLNVGINLDDPEVLSEVLSGLRARKIQVPKVESDPNVPFPGEQEPIMPPQVLLPVIDQDACAGAGFDYSDVEAYAVDWLPYPIEALGGPIGPHKPYFVKVSGDSMVGVGIVDGCMVAINPNVEVRNGDNVYVRWKGRCSIKGFIEYSDRIELRPANRDYQSTWIDREDWEELRILGKVVRVFNLSVPGSVL